LLRPQSLLNSRTLTTPSPFCSRARSAAASLVGRPLGRCGWCTLAACRQECGTSASPGGFIALATPMYLDRLDPQIPCPCSLDARTACSVDEHPVPTAGTTDAVTQRLARCCTAAFKRAARLPTSSAPASLSAVRASVEEHARPSFECATNAYAVPVAENRFVWRRTARRLISQATRHHATYKYLRASRQPLYFVPS
jgi:hypothetical protein